MITEARIQPEWHSRSVEVIVARRGEHGATVLLPGDATHFDNWVDVPEGSAAPASYHFSDEVAKALLDALLDHFRGGHDARDLRKDYDSERARVDKMIEALIASRNA